MPKFEGTVNRILFGLLLLLEGVVIWAVADPIAPAPSSSNSNFLAIFLATNGPAHPADVGLAGMKLAPKPLLADHDFVNYNIKTHEFSITAKAVKRMHNELQGLNIPFVMVANGEQVYRGDFQNALSSTMSMGCPRIEFFDSVPQTNYLIESAVFMPEIPAGTSLIRGDESNLVVRTADGKTNIIHVTPPPDVRNDPRILTALDNLFGLGKSFH
jgi:hypothetical protein